MNRVNHHTIHGESDMVVVPASFHLTGKTERIANSVSRDVKSTLLCSRYDICWVCRRSKSRREVGKKRFVERRRSEDTPTHAVQQPYNFLLTCIDHHSHVYSNGVVTNNLAHIRLWESRNNGVEQQRSRGLGHPVHYLPRNNLLSRRRVGYRDGSKP